jgi:glucose-fructose oxidoreductase
MSGTEKAIIRKTRVAMPPAKQLTDARTHRRVVVFRFLLFATLFLSFCAPLSAPAQTTPAQTVALPVAIVGLVHGHVTGFLGSEQMHRSDVKVVAIVEPDAALRDKYQRLYKLPKEMFFANIDSMLQVHKPQALLVYTDIASHRRVIETAARHGINVMVEKPLATSYADALAIERAAKASHIHVLVNYETTWYASNLDAYTLLHSGAIGPARKVVFRDGHNGPKEINVQPEFLAWLTDPRKNGAGALFDFGCYGADLMTWLMDGHAPETVTAVTQQLKPDIYPHVDDEATILLTYPHAQAIIQASWNWPFAIKDTTIYGATGEAQTVLKDQLRVHKPGQPESIGTSPPLPAAIGDPLTYLKAVLDSTLPDEGLSSLRTNMIVMRILDAARESARTGKTVNLR